MRDRVDLTVEICRSQDVHLGNGPGDLTPVFRLGAHSGRSVDGGYENPPKRQSKQPCVFLRLVEQRREAPVAAQGEYAG